MKLTPHKLVGWGCRRLGISYS